MAFAVRLFNSLTHRTLNHVLPFSGLRLNSPMLPLVTRDLWTTPVVMAMPAKRKRKMDPMILRAREEKRQKRLQRALKKMEKKSRIVRPLLELEPSVELINEAETRRKRAKISISDDVMNERALLHKEWSRFSGARHLSEIHQIDTVIMSQQHALDVLREESEELYAEAIQPDATLIPFQYTGPTRSPPIPDHIVDGTYEDVTKRFSVQYADMKMFMTQLLTRHRKKKKTEEEADD